MFPRISNGKCKHYLIFGPKGIQVEPFPPPPPPFPAVFLAARGRIAPAEDAERFGRLEITGRQDVLLKVLKAVEPRLRRLSVVVTGSLPMIYGDLGLGPTVLSVSGQLTRLFGTADVMIFACTGWKPWGKLPG